MGVLWETSFLIFLFITVVLGGGAAVLAGRALALHWRPWWHAILYMVLLAVAIRFFHFALFEDLAGTLLSLHYYLVDLAILLIAALGGYWITRSRQLVRQYPWLYERRGLAAVPRRGAQTGGESAD